MAEPRKKRRLILKVLLGILGFIVSITLFLAVFLFIQIHRTNGSIISGGEKRTYLLYVPGGYRPDQPTALVISIHGYAEWAAHEMEISHWNQVAEENNFIVVYPTGTGFPLRWQGSTPKPDNRDVQFISDLIDQLEQEYNIDHERIYANGLSNGGGMSFALSCELSDRIAAFGGVSGAYLLPWKDCTPTRPVPAILFHGTADPIVPFKGGPSAYFNIPFPVVSDWVAQLAARNGCSPDPVQLSAIKDVSALHYLDCTANADVIYYVITGGGHTWPGGEPLPTLLTGETTQTIDATRLMWQFFQQHPMKY